MQTGIIQVNGKVYYLLSSGAMATGTVDINGVSYKFAASGEATGDNIPKADKAFTLSGVLVKVNNNNSDSTDTDTDTDDVVEPSGGGSSHGGGGSSTPAALSNYKNSADITVESVETNTYKVTFNNDLVSKKDGDYVVRDLYVTNEGAEITKEDDGSYLVEVKDGETLNVKGITRVVRSGQVYYITGTTK